MAVNTQRNDIIMNPNTDSRTAMNAIKAAVGIEETKQPGPIRMALGDLYNSICTAQKMQQGLEAQLSQVLATYPVNTMLDGQNIDNEPRDSTGCQLSDEIYLLIRMVNSLVDRQEAMSRHVQL